VNDWETKGRTAVEYRRIKNFIDEVSRAVLGHAVPFRAEVRVVPQAIPLGQSILLERHPIVEGQVWGRTWDSGYFHLDAEVPPLLDHRPLAAWLDFGGEGLIYDPSGEPLGSVTNGSAFAEHYGKDVWRLAPRPSGTRVELWVEAAANNLFGVVPAPVPASKDDPARHGTYEARLVRARLCGFDEATWHLHLDLVHLLTLWEGLDPGSVRAVRLLRCLFSVTQAWHGDPARSSLCRDLLKPVLNLPASASSLSTTAVGHAHIDTAWLWRLEETRRKVTRTYAAQLDLIDRYPGYVFGASAPQHHAWVQQTHPGLYARIRKAVAEGRWEPQGGMWVEADCNLPSGESLVRQFLHGKNFWKDEFGVEVRNCWIPDVFGYAASMPQILRQAGVDFFLTQKLSWSKFTVFPHTTFRWRGIDGSEVVTHFPPEDTYNSDAAPDGLLKAEKRFQEKGFLDEFLTLMGIGDGGGGPKEEHLEHVLRSQNCEGLPRASFGRSEALFDRLRSHSAELEVWVGELYLEYHRGTYTTQARTKAHNRRLEQAIRVTEALWAALPVAEYPRAELDAVVKTLLLHQFHDILPGSSIHAVYQDAEAAYSQAFQTLDTLVSRAGCRLLSAEAGAVTFFNCLSSPWTGTWTFEGAIELFDRQGRRLATQTEGEGTAVGVWLAPQSFTTFYRKPAAGPAPVGSCDPLVLENDRAFYRFDKGGRILEARDKASGRSYLKVGVLANVFSLYEDTPHNFDAWDIDYYYRNQFLEEARCLGVEALARGPVRSGTRFLLCLGQSTLTQDVWLEAGSKSLRFVTHIAWNESRRLLKVAFPLDSLATEAVCEIAYGHVSRPTHANTEADFAKFEVCAHRWVAIGDATGGTALLNDAKYGHSVRDNVLELTLLRSPLYPDPDADQGSHRFTYVLAPFDGPVVASGILEEAAALNRPPLVFLDQGGQAVVPLTWEGEGVSLEVLKKAEKEEAWIVRLVETRGRPAQGVLRTSLRGARVSTTDILEWRDGHESGFDQGLPVVLRPFEIASFKIWPGV